MARLCLNISWGRTRQDCLSKVLKEISVLYRDERESARVIERSLYAKQIGKEREREYAN